MSPKDGLLFNGNLHKCTITECATKYNRERKVDFLEDTLETSEHRERRHEVTEESEVEETTRVTTRLRLNYQLYKYAKNAMLIVTTELEEAYWTRLMTDLKQTFESFRFEVDIAIVSGPDGLYAACEQFFLRDFTDYGAVALAIVTNMAVNKCTHPYPRDCDGFMFFEESKVVANFRLDRNLTLENKPKIYITEANRRSPSRSYHDMPYFDDETYGDVLGFHVPLALPDDLHETNLIGSYDGNPRPLKMLCDKMVDSCGGSSVPTIMEDIIQAAKKRFPLLCAFPVEIMNNLREQLFFFTESQ